MIIVINEIRFQLVQCSLFLTLQRAAKTPWQPQPSTARQKWPPWQKVTWLDEQQRVYPSEILSICVCSTPSSIFHPVPVIHTTTHLSVSQHVFAWPHSVWRTLTSVLNILDTFKLVSCMSSYLKWLCQQHLNSLPSDNFV